MVMYKIDRRGGGPKNRSLGNYHGPQMHCMQLNMNFKIAD